MKSPANCHVPRLRSDVDPAHQDLLEDLPSRRHVGLEGRRPAGPHPPQALYLFPLVSKVALVALQVGDTGLGLTTLLPRSLQPGHQGVHVVRRPDDLGEPGLGVGRLGPETRRYGTPAGNRTFVC